MFTKKLKPLWIFLFTSGAMAFFNMLSFTVNMVYQVQEVELNALQLVLIGTSLEVSVLLFEVPTGIVADVYSRRLSVIIGMIITGLGFMLQGIPSFPAIVLANIIWGFGWTFISGAHGAWIADELNDESQLSKVFLRSSQFGQIGGLIGIGVSMVLGTIALRIPIVLAGAFYVVLGFFLMAFMGEEGFKPVRGEERSNWGSMVDTFKAAWNVMHQRTIFVTILLVTLFYGMYSEGFDRLWTKHMLDFYTFPDWHLDINIGLGLFDVPIYLNLGEDVVIWFGIIAGVMRVLGFLSTELFQRFVATDTPRSLMRSLLTINVLIIVGLFSFAQIRWFVPMLMAYFAIGVFRTLYYPLWATWVNQHSPSEVRATMMSAASQMDAFGQIAGGPIVGWAGVVSGSTRVAITMSSMLLTPVIFLYTRALYRNSLDEQINESPPDQPV